MQDYSPREASIIKGDKYSVPQCPKTELKKDAMKNISFASTVGSLMYVQVGTRPDIAYTISVLGRFQYNLGMIHWKQPKM